MKKMDEKTMDIVGADLRTVNNHIIGNIYFGKKIVLKNKKSSVNTYNAVLIIEDFSIKTYFMNIQCYNLHFIEA